MTGDDDVLAAEVPVEDRRSRLPWMAKMFANRVLSTKFVVEIELRV